MSEQNVSNVTCIEINSTEEIQTEEIQASSSDNMFSNSIITFANNKFLTDPKAKSINIEYIRPDSAVFLKKNAYQVLHVLSTDTLYTYIEGESFLVADGFLSARMTPYNRISIENLDRRLSAITGIYNIHIIFRRDLRDRENFQVIFYVIEEVM